MYKVLIVDDEKMIRMGIKAALPWQSYNISEVYTAASGMEALSLLKEHMPELMITDINMTEMTGLELIEQVKKINPEIKIIVLTGYDEFYYAHQCLRLKVDDFFLKPVDETEFGKCIRKILDAIEMKNDLEQKQKLQRRAQGVTEQLLLERVMRNVVHDRAVKEEYEYLTGQCGFDPDGMMQIAVVIPSIDLEQDRNEENFMLLSIKNTCIDLFDSRGEGITFDDDDGKLMLAVFENSRSDEILNRISHFNNILKIEYNIRPRVVVGGLIRGFEKLKISYNDAVYLLDSEKGNIQEIIQTHFSEDRIRIFHEVYMELKHIMILNTGNLDTIAKAFHTFRQATQSYNLGSSMIKRCCFEMAASLYFSFISNTGENTDNRLNALLGSLTNAEKEDALEFTGEFILQLFRGEEENQHEIIDKAKTYIKDHLAEELSVASMASIFFVTPNYFSRLFKKVTGEGCSEYIVRKRIEKARALLEATSLKTGKIAFMVGYNDTNYFSLAFKKYTGVSPTKYREIYLGEESGMEEK